ncbi:MAG: hypothetical protein AAGC61_01755 [Microbacterium sp.]
MPKIVLMRKDEAVYRDVDAVDQAVPEYFRLSDNEYEVYHHHGEFDHEGVAVYELAGTESPATYPNVHGGS